MKEEMKAMRDVENARKLKIALESEDGLNLETKRIETIVDYTAKGGGNAKAKARNGKTYNSKRKIKKVPVPEPKAKQEKIRLAEILEAVKGLIFFK